MTIKEEIQLEEYKRTFAEAYKQGFMDAMSVCKTEPQIEYCPRCGMRILVDKPKDEPKDEPQTDGYISGEDFMKIFDEPQTDCAWK